MHGQTMMIDARAASTTEQVSPEEAERELIGLVSTLVTQVRWWRRRTLYLQKCIARQQQQLDRIEGPRPADAPGKAVR